MAEIKREDSGLEACFETLRRKGGRITPVVKAVVRRLFASGEAHSPQKLREEICKELNCNIGFPTIYRVLDRLQQAGLVLPYHNKISQSAYFLCRPSRQSHHHHFICRNCNRVQAIDLCITENYQRYVQKALGAMVTDHIIQLEGMCAKCR